MGRPPGRQWRNVGRLRLRCGDDYIPADSRLVIHSGTSPTNAKAMPILDVEIITDESPGPALAGELADMAGNVFGGPPGTTWVRVRTLSPSCYAENGIPEPQGQGAVFVTVLKASPPEGTALEAEIKALTEGVA